MPPADELHTIAEAVARIDERTKKLSDDMHSLVIKINKDIQEIRREFVSKEAFAPVKNVVYGLIGIILMSVVGALVGLIMTGK